MITVYFLYKSLHLLFTYFESILDIRLSPPCLHFSVNIVLHCLELVSPHLYHDLPYFNTEDISSLTRLLYKTKTIFLV